MLVVRWCEKTAEKARRSIFSTEVEMSVHVSKLDGWKEKESRKIQTGRKLRYKALLYYIVVCAAS